MTTTGSAMNARALDLQTRVEKIVTECKALEAEVGGDAYQPLRLARGYLASAAAELAEVAAACEGWPVREVKP